MDYSDRKIQQFASDQRRADEWELEYAEREYKKRPTGYMSDSYRRRIRELRARLAK